MCLHFGKSTLKKLSFPFVNMHKHLNSIYPTILSILLSANQNALFHKTVVCLKRVRLLTLVSEI